MPTPPPRAPTRSCATTRRTDVYKKLVVSTRRAPVLGGMLVGDAAAYGTARADGPGRHAHAGAPRGADPPRSRPGSAATAPLGRGRRHGRHAPRSARARTSPRARICAAIADGVPRPSATSRRTTRAGTGCGGCVPLVTDVLQRRAGQGRRRGRAGAVRALRPQPPGALRPGPGPPATRRFGEVLGAPRHAAGAARSASRPWPRSSPSLTNGYILDDEPGRAAGHQRPLPRQPPEGRHLLGRAPHPRRRDHARGADRHRRGRPRLRALHEDHRRPAHRPVRRPGRAAARRSGSGSSTPASSRATPTASRCAR